MGSSSDIGELRLPASGASGREPRHRAVSDEDQWFSAGVAPRDHLDPSRPERDPLYRGTLGGITNWPDDSLTLPGVAPPPALVDLLAAVPSGVVHARMQGAVDSEHRNDSPGASAVDNAVKEPPAAIAGVPSPAAEPAQGKGDAGVTDGASALGAEEPAHRRVTLPHYIAAVLGTTRGKWAVAAVGATIALIALGVVLALHSHRTSSADGSQASDDSPAATSSGSYPAPAYGNATPSDPSRYTPAPRYSDSHGATSDPSAAGSMPSQDIPPNDPLPPDELSDDPLTPSAATPLANDPQLDQTQPVGPDQMPATSTHGRAGSANPQARPGAGATTPRNSRPLSNSLDSITAPRRPDNSDRGDSDTQGQRKLGDGLPGLGHGL